MFGKKNLQQKGGESSTNLQGQNVTINNGITYTDAKEIALDVFKSNFLELSQTAAITAKARAEELVDDFLKKLEVTDPSKIDMIQDPDMQYAIFTAQKEYARNGEKDMEEMLVDLLIERIGDNTQSLKRIVLNESLEILPKLIKKQLDILTITFLTQETVNHTINNLETLKYYLETHYVPFLSDLSVDKASYKHLEFTGCCGQIGIAEDNFSQFFINRYKGVFSKGFAKKQFEDIPGYDSSLDTLLIPCFNDPNLLQLNALNDSVLENKFRQIEKSNIFSHYKNLFDNFTMNTEQADNLIIELVPAMSKLISVWRNSYMCAMDPTSVGIMLAHINLKRKANINLKIDIWIN